LETGVNTAVKAAEGIIAADPILGGICVILAVALLALLIWHFRETGRLNREALESERQHGKDALSSQASVTKALETVQHAIAIISAKGR